LGPCPQCHATWAEKLDRKTIDAAIHPVVATEFTAVVGKYPLAFKSYEFVEIKVAVRHP